MSNPQGNEIGLPPAGARNWDGESRVFEHAVDRVRKSLQTLHAEFGVNVMLYGGKDDQGRRFRTFIVHAPDRQIEIGIVENENVVEEDDGREGS